MLGKLTDRRVSSSATQQGLGASPAGFLHSGWQMTVTCGPFSRVIVFEDGGRCCDPYLEPSFQDTSKLVQLGNGRLAPRALAPGGVAGGSGGEGR